jgi:stress response protein SCP2
MEMCRFNLPLDKEHHTAVNFCLLHRDAVHDNTWAVKTLGVTDAHSRNYGMMIPQMKTQLKSFVPNITIRKSDRVSVLRKNQSFKIADCCDNVPDNFTVGLAWDVTQGCNIDLDASIIMLNAQKELVDLVFFGKLSIFYYLFVECCCKFLTVLSTP